MFIRGVMVALGLFCLCAIMFFTGVMVGRGTAPVHFDTRPFQEKLADLASRKERGNPPGKTKLGFYDELKKTVSSDLLLSEDASGKQDSILPTRDTPTVQSTSLALSPGPIPMKKALKGRTREAEAVTPLSDAGLQAKITALSVGPPPGKVPERNTAVTSPGGYTIQISSFRQLVDAIQRMEALKVKGLSPHRALALVDGNVWHRVRVGTYPDALSAEKALKTLEARGIYGIIIQKDE